MRLDTSTRHVAASVNRNAAAAAVRHTAAATVILLLLLAGCVRDTDDVLKEPAASQSQPEATRTAADQSAQDSAAATLYEAMQQDERLTTMTEIVDQLGLNILLDEEGVDYTVFAPSDEAFSTTEQVSLTSLIDPNNAGHLRDIVTTHLVKGVYPPDELRDREGLLAAGDATLNVDADGDSLLVNGARIVEAKTEIDNGMLYIIDQVVLPQEPSLHQREGRATGSTPAAE